MSSIEHSCRVPLSRHPFIATRDLEKMQQRLAEAIEPRHMRVVRGRTVDVVTNAKRLATSKVFWNRYGATVRVRSLVPLSSQHILIPLSGALLSHSGRRERTVVPGTALVNTPGTEVDIEWNDDCAAIVLALDGDPFAHHVHRLMEVDTALPGGETYIVSLGTGAGRSLLTIIEAVLAECDAEHSLIDDGRYCRRVEELLSIALLRSRPSANAVPPDNERRPAFLVRTFDYLVGHADKNISYVDLVAVSGVPSRTLQHAFKRHFGVGPMTYVRNVRLDRIRLELQAASDGETTVGDIAARWGFYHLSHFTAAYKRRFGELPSRTLRDH